MSTIGLDIGGANLKAAHEDGAVRTVAFALWSAPERLEAALARLVGALPPCDRLAVTMTAELCDCFETKRDGVNHVLDAATKIAGEREVRIWITDGCFVSPDEARAAPLGCAAANWHALATWAAGRHLEGRSLLMDVGSTTTDLIPLARGCVAARGLTDAERLATGELVYLGVRRTPLMALGPSIGFRERVHGLMAERFADTYDVFLLTGDLDERPHDTDSADGRPLTRGHAAARLVRMIGADLEMVSHDEASALAEAFRARALDRIASAVRPMGEFDRVIVSGGGAFLAVAAARSACPNAAVVRLADELGEVGAEAACAWAVARLAAQ
ncbi:MAG: H4MPT-linked C1 transfer pathway protein [Phycisphaeraceae bacterium]|nr:H4MPT-linked C1 transfer pathway protein [Phycisphaeraceae bacterium]